MKGKYYIYMFINWDWNAPFYIGKGCGNRYKTLEGRGQQILSIWETYNCSSHIIKYCDDEEMAYKLERSYKECYKNHGCPISDNENYSATMRQREGIERAKQVGKYKGRKPIEVDDFKTYYEQYMRREISKVDLASKLNVSRPTLDRLIRDFKNA